MDKEAEKGKQFIIYGLGERGKIYYNFLRKRVWTDA